MRATGQNEEGVAEQENTTDVKTKPSTSTIQSTSAQQSFANLEKKCCYLCSRQFKEEAEVNKHERLSQLHRDNLKNEDLVTKAKAKLAKVGIASRFTFVAANDDANDANEGYRDRAKERRAAFGASKKISLPMKKSAAAASTNPPTKPGQKPDTSDPADDDGAVAPAPSKGASLLGKMGWSAGSGLGARGTGTTTAIQTDMYVAGVGLGVQGGRIGDAVDEAERNTRGGSDSYAGFAERTRERARGRFEQME